MFGRVLVARRFVLAVIAVGCTALGALALTDVPALAAAPEAPGPVTVQTPVGATKATVHGLLSPNAEGHPGTYEFLYKKSPSSCAGESRAPAEAPGMMLGFEGEEVSQELTALEPHTQYTVCLLARNAKGEETVGPAVTFTTALKLEAPTTTQPAAGVTATTATLQGVLNPGGAGEAGSYEFLYRASATECSGGEASGGSALGKKEEAVSSEVTGLLPNTEYTFCLLARNEAGETALGSPVTFTTSVHVPTVEGESFSDVGSGSATLSAQVNLEHTPGSYHFKYGTSSAYGSQTPAQDLGATEGAVSVLAQLNGLEPSTEYHFRVIVSNASGETAEGGDATFKTQPLSILGLPDGRVFERVTPVSNGSANVYVPNAFGITGLPFEEGTPTRRPFEAAVDGDAVVYPGDPTKTSGGAGRGGNGAGNEYLATRSADGGWTQANLQPAGHVSAVYQAFSSDLSVGILSSPSETGLEAGLPPLAPGAPGEGYNVLYARSNGDGSYQPFFLERPPHRPAEEFGFSKPGGSSQADPPVYVGSSADLSEGLFEANDALTSNAVVGNRYEENLYASVDGRLSLVNVLPEGTSEPNATFGGRPIQAGSGEPDSYDFSHVISADGSRIFWTDLNTGDLYVREDPISSDARTVEVAAGGNFWTATADGSKVFFTKGDLYEYDVESGQTTDLTPGVEAEGVIGASENGEYIYYVDTGQNLRLWHAGSSTLIATLSPEDGSHVSPFEHNESEYPPGDWQPGLGERTAEIAPGGQGVVFMSNQSLKAVDYPEGYRNDGFDEVYVYEADSGRLFCASCNPSGEPPQSNEESENEGGRAAAFLPVSWSNTYQPRWISADGGRVFFDSAEPLVPQDTDGKQDVYEWERDGEGSCREADGCIYLLSGGTGGAASWLLDADTEGENVFIISRTELVPGDPYDSFGVYDARVGGVQPPAPPACSGTGCQGVPPAPPIFATPSSVTFSGVGNFPPLAPAAIKPKPKAKPPRKCKRASEVKKHNKCVKVRAKGKKAKAKKAGDKRRAK